MTPDVPALVACAHGTRDPAGRRAVGLLVRALRTARPDLLVQAAFVDVQSPSVTDVVHRLTTVERSVVVVPLLLSGGFHVHVDIARAVAGTRAVASAALGPDDRLVDLLASRLRESGASPQDAVVLAAAGSSDGRAVADVEAVRERLAERWGGAVSVGFGAKARPSVRSAITAARAEHPGRRVVLASYLLAPGYFHDRLGASGADLVTAPLESADAPADPRIVDVVLERYAAAAS